MSKKSTMSAIAIALMLGAMSIASTAQACGVLKTEDGQIVKDDSGRPVQVGEDCKN